MFITPGVCLSRQVTAKAPILHKMFVSYQTGRNYFLHSDGNRFCGNFVITIKSLVHAVLLYLPWGRLQS